MTELKNKIKKYMSLPRYNHTLSVAEECERLAELFGIDGRNLVIAAYLHDITKDMSEEDQKKLCAEFSATIDDSTLASPKTLHAFSAPFLIKRDFPEYAEDEILEAVRYHTTGKADMSLTEKLLYIADYIEPTRQYEGCKKLREYFYSSKTDLFARLDKTILMSLHNTVDGLTRKKLPIHQETINAYKFLLLNIGERNGK